ncbi:uncharacterized protein LOC112524399 [Cynara cardunculus var. scolymus]|uniref:DUF4220 domain-containing protein n=1 Tax=Cynara cardunculus var. scolymus TaxID=59895 RepID=A0A118K2Z6_CYNCS|nr:uncharacterized protein LOC112524399 [Cynara cardunculus var. scolymus]KVI05176.1 protein of unknown function DUF4220 [Cynara cardunculus var. scolymus]
MVLNILSSLILVDQKRRLIQIFHESLRRQWNKWELRGLVLISLALQIYLIYSGNRRKYIAKRKIRAFIWCAYLMADWIATVALGILVDRSSPYSGDSNNNQYGDLRLMAFWAPFLLLHLGGPDTITAYALVDNELWLRHLLGGVVQTLAAIYITLVSWDGTLLSFLTVPMFLCGIIKYGERTWVLNSADRKNLQDSFLAARHTAEVNYTKFMEEFSLKEAEGYRVTASQMEQGSSPRDYTLPISIHDGILQTANYFFETLKFKWLFVDLVLSFYERDMSRSFFQGLKYEDAFQVIECELGFAYDVLYTKAPIIYTPFGLFFRLFTSSVTLSVLVIFFVSIGLRSHNHEFVDVVITYVLLIGAILLDLYATLSLLFSDWAILWFSRYSSKLPSVNHSSDISLQSALKDKRWSHSMYQFGLLDFCLTQKSSLFYKISSFICFRKRLRNLWVKYWVSVRHLKHLKMSTDLPSFIFKHFHEKSTDPLFHLKILAPCPGTVALETHKNLDDLKWTVEVEFDHSILIWHIATDICYEGDNSKRLKDGNHGIKPEWDDHMHYSKHLADYMLYLLVDCPFMLPIGIGKIRFQDTCIQALAFLEEKNWASKAEAYESLGQVSRNYSPGTVKVSESVLFDACNLAAKLKNMDPNEMWKMVSGVWVEILGYAAGQCNGFDHAQQLHKGGELLTHVWLLMAHLGLTKHFKEESHGRVKLITT